MRLAVVVILVTSACGQTTNETNATDAHSGVVTWVYDGDTIVVETPDGELDVRLLDINAPESDECFYEESLSYLIDVLKGNVVTIDIALEPDQYGRTLAFVRKGETDINLELVEMGLAIATTPGGGQGFLVQEEKAFADRTGLWAVDVCGAGPVYDVRIASVDPFDELVVIANQTSGDVDLSGWTIRDESSRHRYRFPEGVNLAQGGRLAISSEAPGWSPGGSPVWNNDGDMALLLDSHGRVVDRWRY